MGIPNGWLSLYDTSDQNITIGQTIETREMEGKMFLTLRDCARWVFVYAILLFSSVIYPLQAGSQETRPGAPGRSGSTNSPPILSQNQTQPDVSRPNPLEKKVPLATVQVESIKITGNTLISLDELAPLVRPYIGKKLSVAELQEVADAITKAYRERGFLAKAYIPEQTIKTGVVEVAVLEGKIGEIHIEGNEHYSTPFIKKHFFAAEREKGMKSSTLEKALLLLNDYPDLKARALLQEGKTPGTTDVVVDVEDKRPLHLSLDYNNFGSESVSRNRYGLGLDFGNLLFEGSTLSLRGLVGSPIEGMAYGRAAYSVPINYRGTKLNLSYAQGDFDVGRELAILAIKMRVKSAGASLSHPFVKSRLSSLTGEFGFDAKNFKQSILGNVSSHDKIRLIRLGLTYDRIDATGRNFVSLYGSKGLGDRLGGMEEDDPFSSRFIAGADNDFLKWNLDLARFQRISRSFSLILRGAGQLSSESLVAGEQFSVGGPDSVRGYPIGEFLADGGYNVSSELRISPLPNKELFQLAAFYDRGGGRVQIPAPGLRRRQTLSGYGYGLRINFPYQLKLKNPDVDVSGVDVPYRFYLRADVGVPIDPPEASTGKDATYYVQAVLRF